MPNSGTHHAGCLIRPFPFLERLLFQSIAYGFSGHDGFSELFLSTEGDFGYLDTVFVVDDGQNMIVAKE